MLVSTPVQLAHLPMKTQMKRAIEPTNDGLHKNVVQADVIENMKIQANGLEGLLIYLKGLPIMQLLYKLLDILFKFLTAHIDTDLMIRIMFYYLIVKSYMQTMGYVMPI